MDLPEYECISEGETAPDWGIFTTREELARRDDDVSFYSWMADDPSTGASSLNSTAPLRTRKADEEIWPPTPVIEIPKYVISPVLSSDIGLTVLQSH